MSSLVSVGGHSDLTFEDRDHDFDIGMALSENGDTDYDLDSEEEELEEDEEEEEEEDSGDDESQIQALIDDSEVKFRILLKSKISDVESFFDDNNDDFPRSFSHLTLLEKQINVSESVANMSYNDEGIDEGEMGSKERIKKFDKSFSKESQMSLKDESTQTEVVMPDDVTAMSLQTSESKTISGTPEQARAEIGQLRDVRESLIAQRQQWAAQLKQVEERSEKEAKKVECKVYEIEEAIEAVDTAIEFKNEVVLGQPPNKVVANDDSPGSSEVELVTRLESLSIDELRRLLCVYFAKVVELRSSSRRLEKNLEHAETISDQLTYRVQQERKQRKEMQQEYEKRIIAFLRNTNAHSSVQRYIEDLQKQLTTAQKKVYNLEGSLTELLVRHGYLVNGADYDVKQVMKMLGIERSQLPGVAPNPQERDPTRGRTGAVHAPAPHSSRSGWHKVSSRGASGIGHRRNGRVLDYDLSRNPRDLRFPEGWEREHRQAAPPLHPEVRREKKKLIIQQSNGASTSAFNHHGGGGSHNQHYSAHGSNHHGYK